MHAKSLQSYLTLCHPVDYSRPCSSVHGILQAGVLEWIAVPFCRGSCWSRDRTCVVSLTSPELAGRFFTTSATCKARVIEYGGGKHRTVEMWKGEKLEGYTCDQRQTCPPQSSRLSSYAPSSRVTLTHCLRHKTVGSPGSHPSSPLSPPPGLGSAPCSLSSSSGSTKVLPRSSS